MSSPAFVKFPGSFHDKSKVKIKALLFIAIFVLSGSVQAQSSRVYRCHFTDEINPVNSIRMKEYFDVSLNRDMGKIDLFRGSDLQESAATQVYSLPLYDSETYVKMWYSPQMRVDATLSWNESSREFLASYLKGSQKRQIYCSQQSE